MESNRGPAVKEVKGKTDDVKQSSELILIDPLKLDDLDVKTRLILSLLLNNNENTIFHRGERYPITHEGKIYEFFFKNTLIPRYKINIDTDTAEIRYAVVDKEAFGKGSYGGVYSILGTLYVKQEMRYKELKSDAEQLVKIMSTAVAGPLGQQEYYDNVIRKETLNLMRLPYFHAKPTWLEKGKGDDYSYYSYTIFRKFEGKSLADLINLIKTDKIAKLTSIQKLTLITNLLRRLKEQLHDYKMIHCDVKPDNIIVNPFTLEVNYIDVGVSFETGTKTHVAHGTPFYLAPEFLFLELEAQVTSQLRFLNMQKEKDELLKILKEYKKIIPDSNEITINEGIDIASLSLVIAEILGIDIKEFKNEKGELIKNRSAEFYLSRLKKNDYTYFNVENAPLNELEIHEAYKKEIRNQLSMMIAPNPDERPNLMDLINVFEGLKITTEYKNAKADERDDIFKAHEIGCDVYQKLREINLRGRDNGEIFAVISKGMNSFDSTNPILLKVFTEALQAHTLPLDQPKNVLLLSIKGNISLFNSYRKKLYTMRSEIETLRFVLTSINSNDLNLLAINELILKLSTYINKFEKKDGNIDAMIKLSNEFDSKMETLKDNRDDIIKKATGEYNKIFQHLSIVEQTREHLLAYQKIALMTKDKDLTHYISPKLNDLHQLIFDEINLIKKNSSPSQEHITRLTELTKNESKLGYSLIEDMKEIRSLIKSKKFLRPINMAICEAIEKFIQDSLNPGYFSSSTTLLNKNKRQEIKEIISLLSKSDDDGKVISAIKIRLAKQDDSLFGKDKSLLSCILQAIANYDDKFIKETSRIEVPKK